MPRTPLAMPGAALPAGLPLAAKLAPPKQNLVYSPEDCLLTSSSLLSADMIFIALLPATISRLFLLPSADFGRCKVSILPSSLIEGLVPLPFSTCISPSTGITSEGRLRLDVWGILVSWFFGKVSSKSAIVYTTLFLKLTNKCAGMAFVLNVPFVNGFIPWTK